VQDRILIVWCV